MRDSKVEKWRTWCDGRIKDEVLTLHLHRYVWLEVARMLQTYGDALPVSYYWEFMRDSYVVMQSVAVRRHADVGTRVVSLGRMLTEISAEPERITPAVIRSIWQPQDDWDRRDVDQAVTEWCGPAGPHLERSKPEADLAALLASAGKVRAYVDRHVAHSDAKPVPSTSLPSLDDLHAAVDSIGDVFRRYYLLLSGTDMPILVPVIQHDWLAVFRQRWIPEGERFFAKSPWESPTP